MTETAFEQFWQLLWGGLSFNPQQFYNINHIPQGTIAALIVVLIAGLSQAIKQSIVFFINTVKPLRFIFSLAVFAILFVFTYCDLHGTCGRLAADLYRRSLVRYLSPLFCASPVQVC